MAGFDKHSHLLRPSQSKLNMAPPAVDRMPIELWDRIVTFICKHETTENTIKLCRALCLTSRAVNIAATPLLYKHPRTDFHDGNTSRLLSTLLRDSQLSSYVQSLRLTKDVEKVEPRCEKDADETEFYQTCEQQFHNFAQGRRSALIPKMVTYAELVPVWYSVERFLDNGNDMRMLGRIIAQMQKDGYLGNLRAVRLDIKGQSKAPICSLMDTTTALMSIPHIELLYLKIDQLWPEMLSGSHNATSNVKNITLTSLTDYDEHSTDQLTNIVRQCKSLERLAIGLFSRQYRSVSLPNGTFIRPPMARTETVVNDERAVKFKMLFECLVPHQDTLKSLSIDAMIFHPRFSHANNTLAAFKGLEVLRIDMAIHGWSSEELSCIKNLMAPNLKSLTIFTYNHPFGVFEIIGSVMRYATTPLQHLQLITISVRERVLFDSSDWLVQFHTESFNMSYKVNFGFDHTMVVETHDLQEAIRRCETTDAAAFSPREQSSLERLIADPHVRRLIFGTTIARDFLSILGRIDHF